MAQVSRTTRIGELLQIFPDAEGILMEIGMHCLS